jgi:sortase B
MSKDELTKILTALFSLVIFICFFFICKDLIEYKRAEREYEKLNNMISDELSTKAGSSGDSPILSDISDCKKSDFDRLYDINNDLVCILSIPDLDLKYPVVRGPDNSRYLTKTFEGNNNPAGCLFIDYENSPDLSDNNTFIYGHNMKNGSMFGSLKNFTKDGFNCASAKAYVTTDVGTMTYSFKDAKVVDINEYKAPLDEKGLLTLYTCWRNDKDRRLLVTFSKS